MCGLVVAWPGRQGLAVWLGAGVWVVGWTGVHVWVGEGLCVVWWWLGQAGRGWLCGCVQVCVVGKGRHVCGTMVAMVWVICHWGRVGCGGVEAWVWYNGVNGMCEDCCWKV